MEAKKTKKLSKAERKRLYICTERAFDLVKRMEELVEILRKKEYSDADRLSDEMTHIAQTYRYL